jgi:DUF917 family protein
MGNSMLRTRKECEDFVRGLSFMGTGGGGGSKESLELLVDQLEAGRDISWVDVDSLPDHVWTATVAMVGGRVAEGGTREELAELGCVEQRYDSPGLIVAAIHALQDYAGVELAAIVPVEICDVNVTMPMAAALELALPVVDGDYSGGRAAPEIRHGVPEIRGMPVCPMSFVTRWGDVLILKDTVSVAMADRIGRMVNMASYGWIGTCWDLMQVRKVKQVLAAGTLSKALHIGQAIRTAREKRLDPVAAAVKAVRGWLLFEGEIADTQTADEESYAFGVGTHTLKGLRSYKDHTLGIWYKNEFHVSWKDGKPFVTSPDSLIMVDLKTAEPGISFDFSAGDQVAVIGCKAHQGLLTEAGIEAYGPRYFGFDIDYVPIEERLERLAF